MTIVISLPTKKAKTKNIANTVSKFAAENILKPKQYTFALNGVKTYIKTIANKDFVLYEEDINNYYNDNDKLINEHVEFEQIYVITITTDFTKTIDLNYEINFSDNNITPSIIIYPDSIIPYKKYTAKQIYMLLLKELNRIKAKNKILIKIFDTQMTNKLKAFVKYLYQGKFVKKIKLPLFDGIEPEVTRNSKVIKHFLKKQTKNQVIEVDADELLVEYIKPIFGKNGLNAFGKIITNNYTKNKSDIEAHADEETIEIIEDKNKKLYKSKIKGFIHFDNTKFYIDNKIKMKRLSRIENAVAKDEDNNIEVVIDQNDTDIDSVGEGVNLVSEVIQINGHVGAKTKLEATNLTIDGATHGDSIQEARFAKINRHKGKLRCHNAKIKLLEGGEIHATDVEVDTSLGGSIYAENVIVHNVKNNLKIYASNSITIKKVSGEDNLFKINYKAVSTLISKYNFLEKEVEELKEDVEAASKNAQQLIPALKEKINILQKQQLDIQMSVYKAKITIEEPLNGLNTIVFTIDKDNEIIFKTEARKYKEFHLEQTPTHVILHPTDKKISLDS